MRSFTLVLSILVSSLSFAETWYGFCIAAKNDIRYCTKPTLKIDDFKLRCSAFARELGANSVAMRYSTDFEGLESSMGEHCDEIKGDDNGSTYACQIASLCSNNEERLQHLASRVYADNKAKAIERCSATNDVRIRQELKKQSTADCYIRVVVEKMN